jgi:hypothetical protein
VNTAATETEAVSPAALARLQAHPQFQAAAASSMRGSIEVHQSGGLANWILSDRARAAFGHSVLYLHAISRPDDPRLTPANVKQLAVATGLCSSGRAAAMLALMRVAGFLAQTPPTSDRRVRRLVPTEKLMAMQRTRLRLQFEAMAMMLPSAQQALPLFGRSEFELALARAIGDSFVSGTRMLAHAPDLQPLADRSAGIVVLFSLLLASYEAGAFVVNRPIALSIAALSRQFRVSRSQILRVLREAEARKFITRTGASYENVVVLPKLKQDILALVATAFLFLADAADKAMAELRRAA